ncbi:hypothetical protein M433DRAFT_133627 [Acidomyces richmondensis BFW]|nr:MAG: hypothetical protein FE78DRAFT_70814 [Acidomyces sp. 'richmondensis']KYG46718.1 hypothetical protein M433DRAFT_133627 [Acidomyces richmondensis BFW]
MKPMRFGWSVIDLLSGESASLTSIIAACLYQSEVWTVVSGGDASSTDSTERDADASLETGPDQMQVDKRTRLCAWMETQLDRIERDDITGVKSSRRGKCEKTSSLKFWYGQPWAVPRGHSQGLAPRRRGEGEQNAGYGVLSPPTPSVPGLLPPPSKHLTGIHQ